MHVCVWFKVGFMQTNLYTVGYDDLYVCEAENVLSIWINKDNEIHLRFAKYHFK